MRLVLFLAVLAMAGCATVPPPEPQVRVVQQLVEIPVPCKAQVPAEPVYQLSVTDPEADVDVLMRAALAEVEQRAGHEVRLKSALESCR